MKFISFCLSCICLINGAYSDEYMEIEARDGESNRTIEVEFSHNVTIGKIEIVHMNLVTDIERDLAKIDDFGSVNSTKDETTGYNITVTESTDNMTTVQLLIQSVVFDDDGLITFSVMNTDESLTFTMSRVLTVLRPASNLKLKLGSLTAVDMSSQSNLVHEVDTGDTIALCVAEGSNPATSNFTLTLNGQEVTTYNLHESQRTSSFERIYSRTANATIDIEVMNGQRQNLECAIIDPVGNTLNTKLYFKVDVSGSECWGPFMNMIVFLVMTVLWFQM